jgi:hypothetical protein
MSPRYDTLIRGLAKKLMRRKQNEELRYSIEIDELKHGECPLRFLK